MGASWTHPRSVGLYIDHPATILNSNDRLDISHLQNLVIAKPVPCTGNSRVLLAREWCRHHDIMQTQRQPVHALQLTGGGAPMRGKAGAYCRTSSLEQQLP